MFLRKSKRNNRIYLQIIKGYREDGKVKHKVIKSCGFLDELQEQYDDPIAHFKKLAQTLTLEDKQNHLLSITLHKDIKNSISSHHCYNLGYIYMQNVFYRLGLPDFFDDQSKKLNLPFSLTENIQKRIYTRLLSSNNHMIKINFFEKFTDYDNISLYSDIWETLLKQYIFEHIQNVYHYDLSTSYLLFMDDYFNGEHIVLSLLIDKNSIPIDYKTYICDDNHEIDMLVIIHDYHSLYPLNDIIVITDHKFKEDIIDKSGYMTMKEGFRVKIHLPQENWASDDEEFELLNKQILYYNPQLNKYTKESDQYKSIYSIATTHYHISNSEIIALCKQARQYKNFFKIRNHHIIKLYQNDGLNDYMLISFLTMIIHRILLYFIGPEFEENQLIGSLQNCSCTQLEQNIVQCNYYDEILQQLDKICSMDISYRYRSNEDIKNMITNSQNQSTQ